METEEKFEHDLEEVITFFRDECIATTYGGAGILCKGEHEIVGLERAATSSIIAVFIEDGVSDSMIRRFKGKISIYKNYRALVSSKHINKIYISEYIQNKDIYEYVYARKVTRILKPDFDRPDSCRLAHNTT